jgi:hypothetical protein
MRTGIALSDMCLHFVESLLVTVGAPLGEEILVVAWKQRKIQ